MPPEIRRAFLFCGAFFVVVAVLWASVFDALPPADFSLQSGTDAKTLDPARATGNIEGRLLDALFEGLLRTLPEGPIDPETGVQPQTPQPAMAESYDVSEDGRTYTFHIRRDARWSNGDPVTSHDFRWSWLRLLHPESASEYAFHLHQLPYAEAYNLAQVAVGDRVEVELWNRPGDSDSEQGDLQPFPRGDLVHGVLRRIVKPDEPQPAAGLAEEDQQRLKAEWMERWVYEVETRPEAADGEIDWEATGELRRFTQGFQTSQAAEDIERVHHVLVAFDRLGALETPDDQTFIVNLKNPVPYFPHVVAFYSLYPVHRGCVEEHGSPQWTKPGAIVSNGPYVLQLRRLRDRLRVVKNDQYWNAEATGFEVVDFLSVESETTAMNMYETDQIQWVTAPPAALLEELRSREDFIRAPQLSVYFYRLNTTRPPMDDVRVRRAIAMAIDRTEIVEEVTKGGQLPSFSAVPPGLAGYKNASGLTYDVEEARRLLSEAGYPNGRGMPKVTILYNTSEGHRAIAEVIQQQLRNNLNIAVGLQNMEWGSYLDKVFQVDYQMARAGWIADYPDPNTFLDMWVTDGPQNSTGWSNAEYDDLIRRASAEGDPAARMELLQQAEQIWVEEMPVIPIYSYTSLNMVKPNVVGFAPSAQDKHALHLMRYREPTEEL